MTFDDWIKVARTAMDVMTPYIECNGERPAEFADADWQRAARVYSVVHGRLSAGDDQLAREAIELFLQAPREHRPSMLVVLANKARNEAQDFGQQLLGSF